MRKSSIDQISELEATIRELRAALMRLEQRAAQADQQVNEYETRMKALRAQLTKEQERNDVEGARMRRLGAEGEDRRREVEELRAQSKKLQEDQRTSVAQKNALEGRIEDIEAKHRAELEAARTSNMQDKLRQMLRLQVLAPQVTVSISGHSTVDVKGAPSVAVIKKVMMDKVLPKFAQVMVQEDLQPTSDSKSTEQYVQSVMSSMVTSIEEKLQSVLGNSCVRTAQVG
jgi:predicted nuclease with TOPRIM domain